MKVLISACLLGTNCKYNGGNNRNEVVLRFAEEHEVVPICPESMGGLPSPRVPSEIVDGVVLSKDGDSVDAEFRLGAEKCLAIAKKEQPDLCVLKARSPSCGSRNIYDGTFSGVVIPGQGVTARLLMENGFRVIDEEELAETLG